MRPRSVDAHTRPVVCQFLDLTCAPGALCAPGGFFVSLASLQHAEKVSEAKACAENRAAAAAPGERARISLVEVTRKSLRSGQSSHFVSRAQPFLCSVPSSSVWASALQSGHACPHIAHARLRASRRSLPSGDCAASLSRAFVLCGQERMRPHSHLGRVTFQTNSRKMDAGRHLSMTLADTTSQSCQST
jgi:hypothetical protein